MKIELSDNIKHKINSMYNDIMRMEEVMKLGIPINIKLHIAISAPFFSSNIGYNKIITSSILTDLGYRNDVITCPRVKCIRIFPYNILAKMDFQDKICVANDDVLLANIKWSILHEIYHIFLVYNEKIPLIHGMPIIAKKESLMIINEDDIDMKQCEKFAYSFKRNDDGIEANVFELNINTFDKNYNSMTNVTSDINYTNIIKAKNKIYEMTRNV